jgi:hypothetical protein
MNPHPAALLSPAHTEDEMKAISLWQPWASLWCSERKVHETRHWPTSHRGWLVVHAAKKFVKDIDPGEPLREILDDEFGGHWAMDLPTGALVGMVNIVGCVRTEAMPLGHQSTDDYHCGDFSEGRYGWKRAAFHVFDRAIPFRGQQGMFEIPNDLLPITRNAPLSAGG